MNSALRFTAPESLIMSKLFQDTGEAPPEKDLTGSKDHLLFSRFLTSSIFMARTFSGSPKSVIKPDAS